MNETDVAERLTTCEHQPEPDNVHHIERPEDYLSAGELALLAEEAREEARCGTCHRLREAVSAAIDSLTRWNGDDGSLVVAANIRHLRRALEDPQ